MRKISLEVDVLKVESFETAERGAEERGTVHANVTNALTQCERCPSGPYPCELSYARTNGFAVCQCAEGTGLCVD